MTFRNFVGLESSSSLDTSRNSINTKPMELNNLAYKKGNQPWNKGKISIFKGRTYEEIYGIEKAVELKEIRRKAMLGNTILKGKTYKEIYGDKAVEEIKKRSITKLNDKNPQWKGDDVGYDGLHAWVRRNKPKPEFCEKCGLKPPYDLANISGEYKRDVKDFEWLCRKCHMKSDGRLEKIKKLAKNREENKNGKNK